MSIKRQQLTIDIINILMRFIPAYLFIAILLYKLNSKSALYTLILLPAPILSYLIRKYTHHIWSFLILHGTVLALYLVLVSDLYLKTAYCIYLVILTSVAYYQKSKDNKLENTSAALLILFVMFYIICYLTGIRDLLQLCFILSIVYVLLYVVNSYLLNLEKFVFNHEGMTNIPFRQIRNSNHVMIVFLSSLFLVTMLAFSSIPLDRLLSMLGKLFLRLVRFLISLLHFEEPEDIPEPEEEEQMTVEDYPIPEPSRLMEIIQEILQWVAIILVIAFIIALIMYTLYQIYQYFYLKSEEVVKDKIEFLSPFTQKERIKRERGKIFRNVFGRSNNALMRKFFTQAVTANLKPDTKLDRSLTPSQLSNIILPIPSEATTPFTEDIQTMEQKIKKDQITEYYEKARYSNEECSKDEVQFLKKLLKEKR
jgi:uncharacterized MAPEG superfamily protein